VSLHETPSAVHVQHGTSPNGVRAQILNSVVIVGARWDFGLFVAMLLSMMRAPTSRALLSEVFPPAPLFPMVKLGSGHLLPRGSKYKW
jgi:hypothetical protein